MPSPQAPAEPIGEYPVWGEGFGQQAAQPAGADSLLAAGAAEGPVPTAGTDKAGESGGGGSATPNQPSPFANEDWSGGDVEYGKQVFLNNCARCHGADGKGGNKPGVGVVPTLRDPGWHERMTEKMLASTIAHGKGVMPGFMKSLDGKQLRGVIAFVRTLKRSPDEPAPTPAPAAAPAQPADAQPTAPAPAQPAKPQAQPPNY
jgi:mono/diheme cytochrome c family protein